MSVYAKIAYVIHATGEGVTKTKKDGIPYKFASIEEVYSLLRDVMSSCGLVCIPNVKTVTPVYENRFLVEYEMVMVDTEDGTTFTASWFGEAIPFQTTKNGLYPDDKALGKSHAYAHKYFLLRLFMLTGADDVDPDAIPAAQTQQRPANNQRPPANKPAAPNVTPLVQPEPTPTPEPAAAQSVEDGSAINGVTDHQVKSISINFSNMGYNAAQQDFAILNVSGGSTTSRKELTEAEAAHLIALQNAFLRAHGVFGEVWTTEAQAAAADRHSKQRVASFWELSASELTAFNNAVTKAATPKQPQSA